eukprot:TRINITY_DN1453_c0_g2_i2.p1 TRINITY_DN1453_c0_g2~~TRINITY_DN1453_c0_g2_i2.p1  ORF type:complete len:219 (+),score=70.74 TRINITY_DN1453_c0_g2_i2:674-1330(+)
MLDALCERYGDVLGETNGRRFHAFPTLQGDGWLVGLRSLPRDEVQKELLAFMGVGKKVADCIGLFSLDKFDIIPVDTHVWQIAQTYMPHLRAKRLNDQAYQEIGDFFRKLLGGYAGWAHTLMFAAELAVFKAEAGVASPAPKRPVTASKKPTKKTAKPTQTVKKTETTQSATSPTDSNTSASDANASDAAGVDDGAVKQETLEPVVEPTRPARKRARR